MFHGVRLCGLQICGLWQAGAVKGAAREKVREEKAGAGTQNLLPVHGNQPYPSALKLEKISATVHPLSAAKRKLFCVSRLLSQ
jgi:hypothetical protein